MPFAHLIWHHGCCYSTMVIAAIMVGAGLIAELCAVMQAPIGYQDETGFHPGFERAGNGVDGQWSNPT